MKKILVIGGAGFIGSHLVDELAKNKDSKVTVVDDLSTGRIENILHNLDKINFIKQSFFEYSSNDKFDEVYLLAAKVNDRSENENDYFYNLSLVSKTIPILKKNGSFYFTSSCTVYGNGKDLKEVDGLSPLTNYSHGKLTGELLIQCCIKNYFIFRIGNVFGERQRGDRECGIVAIAKEKLKKNKLLEVYNKGESKRDYIYVKDVVSAILLPKEVGIYNVGSGKSFKTLDLVKAISVDYKFVGSIKESGNLSLNVDKLKKLGWKPTLDVFDYIIGGLL